MRDIFGKEVTQEDIKKEIIKNSNITVIRKKYTMLSEEFSRKNNLKFVKKPEEKLYYLRNEDDIDISQDIGIIYLGQDNFEKVINEIISSPKNKGYWREKEELKIQQLLANTTAEIIYEEYHNLLNSKNIKEDEYFSNIDYVRIAEICELTEEYGYYYGNLVEILSKIEGQNILQVDYFEDWYIEDLGFVMEAVEDILNYLRWIFSNSSMEEQPYYNFI